MNVSQPQLCSRPPASGSSSFWSHLQKIKQMSSTLLPHSSCCAMLQLKQAFSRNSLIQAVREATQPEKQASKLQIFSIPLLQTQSLRIILSSVLSSVVSFYSLSSFSGHWADPGGTPCFALPCAPHLQDHHRSTVCEIPEECPTRQQRVTTESNHILQRTREQQKPRNKSCSQTQDLISTPRITFFSNQMPRCQHKNSNS